MSIVPTDADRAVEAALKQVFEQYRREWRDAIRGKPDIRNYRCLVWIVTNDDMAYAGIRVWRGDVGHWYSGTAVESGLVTHWMPLPQPPLPPAEGKTGSDSQ